MALFVVATPIGNLQDITLRALEVLKSVALVAAEDTRVARRLLGHYGISVPIVALHEHANAAAFKKIERELEGGNDVAYVVDAGTPGISDPGGFLVHTIRRALPDMPIIPVPGSSALTALLSVAGMSGGAFVFLGFPPHKKGRRTFFERVGGYDVPVVLYESPHRIQKTLAELCAAGMGDRNMFMGREITKMFERFYEGTIEEIGARLGDDIPLKGEFAFIINS